MWQFSRNGNQTDRQLTIQTTKQWAAEITLMHGIVVDGGGRAEE